MLKFIGPHVIDTETGWHRGATIALFGFHLGYIGIQWSVPAGMLGIFWNRNSRHIFAIAL